MPWLYEYWSFYPVTILGLSLGGKVRFLLEANVAPLGLVLDVWPVDVIPLPYDLSWCRGGVQVLTGEYARLEQGVCQATTLPQKVAVRASMSVVFSS